MSKYLLAYDRETGTHYITSNPVEYWIEEQGFLVSEMTDGAAKKLATIEENDKVSEEDFRRLEDMYYNLPKVDVWSMSPLNVDSAVDRLAEAVDDFLEACKEVLDNVA